MSRFEDEGSFNFAALRTKLLEKIPYPTKEEIERQASYDRSRNPPNENYGNKAPRRGSDEIVSDLLFGAVDAILLRQYGRDYQLWLKMRGYAKDRWNEVYRSDAA